MPARRGRRRKHNPAQYAGGGPGSGGGAPAFDPTTVTGLVSWYDFSDAATLFTDTGRTTPVASDTDIIKGVTDKSSAGTHLSEATNGPQYKLSIQNSLSVARFDGTNDKLTSTITADASQTLFLVVKKRGAIGGTSQTVLAFGVAGEAQIYTNSGDSATAYMWYANSSAVQVNIGGTATNWTIVEMKFASAASVTPYMSGTAGSGFDPDNLYSTSTAFRIGADAGASLFADSDIGEVLRYDTALSDADRDTVESGLGTKWNITVA